MEDESIDKESVSFGGSKRKEEKMLGAEDGDGDGPTSMVNKGSKSEDESGAGTETGGEGGGMIKNLISSLFHPSDEGGENGKVEGENEAKSGSAERVKDEGNSDGSPGGIIRNIVSHLPPTLLEDAALTTDEASILIHSIIHD